MGISGTFSMSVMLALTGAYFVVELVVGYMFKSLVLQADAFHMFSDIMSLVIGFGAMWMSRQRGINNAGMVTNTFGFARAEIVGALVNSIFLIGLCFNILIESITRFFHPEKIDDPLVVLYVGIGGLAINIVGMFLFHNHAHGHGHDHKHKHKHKNGSAILSHVSIHGAVRYISEAAITNEMENDTADDVDCQCEPLCHERENSTVEKNNACKKLTKNEKSNTNSKAEPIQTAEPKLITAKKGSSGMNMMAVYLHIMGDLFGSIIVIVNSLVLHFVQQEWTVYLDPVLSLISVVILVSSAIPLSKKAALILIQMVPHGMDISKLQQELLNKFECVLSIHDVHIWQLTSTRIICTMHMYFRDHQSYLQNIEDIKKFFHAEGVHSVTIQPEYYSPRQDLTLNNSQVCSIGDREMVQCMIRCDPKECSDFLCCTPR